MGYEFGELTVAGIDEQGRPYRRVLPTYTCAHCTNVVVLRPDRKRDRVKCHSCDGFLCEKNELCRQGCTPLHAMARDRFEGTGKFGRLVPAIMAGATTEDQARQAGLIKE